MKICNNCNQQFDDYENYCPNCGQRLVSRKEPDSKVTLNSFLKAIELKSHEWDQSDSEVMHWLASIFSVAGLVVFWEVAALIGLAFCICGILYGIYSENELNKTISIVVGIICIILCFIIYF